MTMKLSGRLLFLAAAPSAAALIAASPASALVPQVSHDETSASVRTLMLGPGSPLTMAEGQAGYQAVLDRQATEIAALASRVNAFAAATSGETQLTQAQHREALVLKRSDARIRSTLARVPMTGAFAAAPAEVAQLSSLTALVDALRARLAPFVALPVTKPVSVRMNPAALTTTKSETAEDEATEHQDGWCDHDRVASRTGDQSEHSWSFHRDGRRNDR